ncbi:MAG: hypothetical protein A2Y10_13625 [Planctomycetes bacterium GWF2_41_51]|nr:MAG: hypothetical protein A2Y10_13625 [Planctomycetes bacterium GWF2_41_51]HBG27340.1 hypothetical protein [Phycisphaerales bacterium]
MGKRLKKYSFYIISACLILFIAVRYLPSKSRAMRLTEAYIRYTNPRFSTSRGIPGLIQFYLLDKYYNARLKFLLKEDCIIESNSPGGQAHQNSKNNFADSLAGIRFVYDIKRVILKKQVITDSSGFYTSAFMSAYCDGDKIIITETQLTIPKGESAISHITNFIRDPNDREVNQIRQIRQAGMYKKGKGFAGENFGKFWSTLCFSPDGKSLIFSQRSENGSFDIYSIDIDSKKLRKLTGTKYSEVMPFFTPDGKNIVFVSDKEDCLGEPYLIDMDGSNYRRLLPQYFGVREVTYSSNGLIAFTMHDGRSEEIYVMNADGINIKKLTQDGRIKVDISFSADNKNIFFTERFYDPNTNSKVQNQIFSIDVIGTNLHQLFENSLSKTLIFAAKNNILFYTSSLDTQEYESELIMRSITDEKLVSICNGDFTGLAISSDLKSIAFVDDINKPFQSDLYVKEILSGKIKRITDKGAINTGIAPVFSPDGQFLAFVENSSRVAPDYREIKIVSLKDGNIRILTCINDCLK